MAEKFAWYVILIPSIHFKAKKSKDWQRMHPYRLPKLRHEASNTTYDTLFTSRKGWHQQCILHYPHARKQQLWQTLHSVSSPSNQHITKKLHACAKSSDHPTDSSFNETTSLSFWILWPCLVLHLEWELLQPVEIEVAISSSKVEGSREHWTQ